jgi:chemotaxis protein CheC
VSFDVPNELQLDALREVANVGCGHAATALSRLVGGRRVHIELPRAWLRPVDDLAGLLGGAEARVVVASFRMEGELTGRLFLSLTELNARRLCETLLARSHLPPLDETQRSALSEAANIVASACLSAMGGLVGVRLVPSVPTLWDGTADAVAQQATAGMEREGPVLMLEASFVAHLGSVLSGQLLVLPDAPSVRELLRRLGV